MSAKVSVVIPSYNRAHLLPRALESVLAQSRPADEIIVVDDGSTDETAQLVADRYPGVRYLHQDNRGVSAARNRGIAAATGNWIALLDSDDSWLPRKLERQLAALEADPHLLCHTEEIWIRRGKRVNQMKKHEKAGGHIFLRCLPLCVISPSSALLAKSLLDEVGLFDESLPACEDYDLWLRVCARYPVLYLPEPLITKYGGHEDQLSRRYMGMDRFRIRALHKALEQLALSPEDARGARETLLQKIEIYANGARKRGKEEEVAELIALKERWAEESIG
jgi:glycosyltransferase involved in cell wall biosynthesis